MLFCFLANTIVLAVGPKTRDILEKEKVEETLQDLVERNIINAYPPLYDKKGSFVSQFEHTLMIHKDKVEILSRGDDY